jgi:hypothetical protein
MNNIFRHLGFNYSANSNEEQDSISIELSQKKAVHDALIMKYVYTRSSLETKELLLRELEQSIETTESQALAAEDVKHLSSELSTLQGLIDRANGIIIFRVFPGLFLKQ